ncbi:MAG: hypothetical protein HUU37_04850, partial [Bdellovibrionales bacterium]|nr:hypothetical protein [Bdellovibrionales bacterium]
MYASVIVPFPLAPLTYSVPEELASALHPGAPVLVEVRKKRVAGLVLALQANPPAGVERIKPLLGPCSSLPEVSESWVQFLLWIAHYYHYPAGQVLASALPPNPSPPTKPAWRPGKLPPTEETLSQWAKRGGRRLALWNRLKDAGALFSPAPEDRDTLRKLVASGHAEKILLPDDASPEPVHDSTPPGPSPSHDQARALEAICGSLESGKFTTSLLEGVTGSGKTEVYIHAALRARQLGRSV